MNRRMRLGKGSELTVAGTLVTAGLEVYLPCTDDQGVDLVVRIIGDDTVYHYDLEIKTVTGDSRIIRYRPPLSRTEESLLVLHFIQSDSRDEFYFLTAKQAATHVSPGSKWGELVFGQAERQEYAGQTLDALPRFLFARAAKPTVRQVQVEALRYSTAHLGDALRVGKPSWQDGEWVVSLYAPDCENPVGELYLTEDGEVIVSKSATFTSVRTNPNVARTEAPAA